jgi:hypothetical protein
VQLVAEGAVDASRTITAKQITFHSAIKIEAETSGTSATGLAVLGKSIAIDRCPVSSMVR